jgi:hypothetical protein
MSVWVRYVGLLLSGAGGEVAGLLGEWCDLSRSQLAGASAEAAFPLAGRQQRGRQRGCEARPQEEQDGEPNAVYHNIPLVPVTGREA